MKKSSKHTGGIVFSTNPTYSVEVNEDVETLEPSRQKLRIAYERAGRGGKEVTIVRGFEGSESDLKELGKTLKQFCGCGGSVKDNEILIQGDKREQVRTKLLALGYSGTK